MKRGKPLQRKTPLKRTGGPRRKSGPPRQGKILLCQACGEGFYVPQYELKRGRKFCSQACMGKAYSVSKTIPRDFICIVCGVEFEPTGNMKRTRKTCSQACAREAIARTHRGSLNGNWAGGNPNLKPWREARERRCRICGKAPRKLYLHHVVYEQHVRARGGEAFDPRDSLTVCFKCHMGHHHGADGRMPVSKLRPENLEFAVELLGAAARDYFVRYYDVDVLIDVLMGDVVTREQDALKRERDDLRELARRAMSFVESEWGGTSHIANPETGVGQLYAEAERLDALPQD